MFKQFIKERQFLCNVSPATVKCTSRALLGWARNLPLMHS